MKKLSLALALIAVAAASHAATVNWTSGNLASTITDQGDITGVTAYYYVIDEAEYNRLNGGSYNDLIETYVDAKTGQPAAGYVDSSTATQRGSTYGTAKELDMDLDDNDSAYIVAVYIADSEFGGSYAIASTAKYTESEFEDFEESTNTGIGVRAYSEAGNQWAAVPEPTSIALLAIGLAAVGLKRKVA